MLENIKNVSFCAQLKNNSILSAGIKEAHRKSQSPDYLENLQAEQFANAVCVLKSQPEKDIYCLQKSADGSVSLLKNDVPVKTSSVWNSLENNAMDVISNYVQKDLGIDISKLTLEVIKPKFGMYNVKKHIDNAYAELDAAKAEISEVQRFTDKSFVDDVATKLNIKKV